MRLLIITHVQHCQEGTSYFGYGPYVKEMNLWLQHCDSAEVVAHISNRAVTPIDLPYAKKIKFSSIPSISLTSIKEIIRCIWLVPMICYRLFGAMRRADHIHLRCPGNIGLLGALVQLCYPSKCKTAKYAGNWDPAAQQPSSYTLQKRILSNASITKKMQVLVYGDWPDQSKNVRSFFTATYPKEKIPPPREPASGNPFRCLFVGSLAPGKRPLYALKWVKSCMEKGIVCRLDMYGEGAERKTLESFILKEGMQSYVTLHGNQDGATIEASYKQSDFLILPSKSEGWPKVVAEAMFWGVIPLATSISCVPWMLDFGRRGLLLSLNVEDDVTAFAKAISETKQLEQMILEGQQWSQKYTLEALEEGIRQQLCE